MRALFLRGSIVATLALVLGVGCGTSSGDTEGGGGTTTTTTAPTGGGGSGGADTTSTSTSDTTETTTSTPTGPSACEILALPARPWSEGPYGQHRNETADTFTLEMVDGTTWTFAEQWSGCESYVFIPDTIRVSDLNDASIWEKDLSTLLKTSPKNTHYFFVSRASSDENATASTTAMKTRVDDVLAALPPADAEHWKTRVHVAAKRAASLDNWLTGVLSTIGRGGFAIDRFQHIRGIGNLADVKRYKQALADAMAWPWEQNLAYAANEVRYFNFEVDRQTALDAVEATVIPFWDGEILAEFAEKEIDLPSEADMAAFDTLEIDVTSNCPDPEKIEFGNCGAWDYLAYLFVKDDLGNNVELGRFITSYHRETRWVVDASPMLALLKKGGKRTFRWEFAPPWNTQPTATKLSLRLSNKAKGYAPSEATFLFSGGGFNPTYNDTKLPIDVPIPADAKHVELVAIITGHGAGTSQCAEFCNHQHEFRVNGAEHVKAHPEAGTQAKCVDHIEQGMVPNQGGTWWFGRGGWCPGQQVDPWIVDVTAEVTPGETATIEYEGLFKNTTPPDGAGDIALTSYLVVYK